jgi:hypothetical protein
VATKKIYVQLLEPLGAYLGPNFKIIPNVGTASPDVFSKTNLINGITTFVDINATFITIKSLGDKCNNQITYPIGYQITTTTSTSTTTLPPTTTSTTTVANATTTTINPNSPICFTWYAPFPNISSLSIVGDLPGYAGKRVYDLSPVGFVYWSPFNSRWQFSSGLEAGTLFSILDNNTPTPISGTPNQWQSSSSVLGTASMLSSTYGSCSPTTTSTTSTSTTSTSTTSTTSTSTTSTTTIPPTTTTTTAAPGTCKCYKIRNTSSTGTVSGSYNPCNGSGGSILISPSQSQYICTTNESSINYILNGNLTIRTEVTSSMSDYAYCPCSGLPTPTTIPPSTTTSTSTTTLPPTTTTTTTIYTWAASAAFPELSQSLSLGCSNQFTYYTKLHPTNPDFENQSNSILYNNSSVTTPVNIPAPNSFLTISSGNDIWNIQILNPTSGIVDAIYLGKCNSPHIFVNVDKYGASGSENLRLQFLIDNANINSNITITGTLMTFSAISCQGSPTNANVPFSYTIPSGTTSGSILYSSNLISGVNILSAKIYNLIVGGVSISNIIQDVDISTTKYLIISQINSCENFQ